MDEDLVDVWASASTTSKAVTKFKDFSKKQMNAVKAVVVPKGGQSFNPQAEAHQSLLKQVIQREEKEIEERYRGSLMHKQNEAAPVTRMLIERHAELEAKRLENKEESEESQVDSDASSEEEEEADKAVGKPVSRAKKLTQA